MPAPATPPTKPVSGVPARPAAPVVALAFLAMLVAGVVATALSPATWRAPDADLIEGRDLLSGRWATAYQGALDEASPWRPVARTAWNALDLVLFRQAPAGVLLGAGGWLFSEEEYDVDARHVRRAWMSRIGAVATRLERDDVDLVVALVPAKAALVGARPHPLPAVAQARYDDTLTDLAALGIAAVDLRPALGALGERAWLRTDTHWTPAGATAAAAAIADAVARADPSARGDETFTTEVVGTEAMYGDLADLLALGPLRERIAPPPDVLEQTETVSSGSDTNDLFAAVDLPVAVVGTSYAADPRWNLAERLRVALGRDVLDVARSGIGPLRPMLEYLDGDAWARERPRVVVWEVPVRYLTDDTYLDTAPVR